MKLPTLVGSYRIERLLGVGSFATVWLGFDPALDARVAIKVLAENWSHDLRVRERFLDEARLLWRLDHERLVRVHAVGELDDGRPYLVMAWAQGGSLRDRLAAGPMPLPLRLSLLREVAAGAAVLHANGIVHRDLTPGNVLFRCPSGAPTPDRTSLADTGSASAAPAGAPSRPAAPAGATPRPAEPDSFAGQVLIADLGLAKALAAASGLTARAGTPGFMAPEQDDPLAVVDARTDVYGLGRLGVALLGVPTVDRVGLPALRSGTPPKAAAVLRKATAREPADRYPDAAAFLTAFDRATTPRWIGSRLLSAGRRRPLVVGVALVLAAVAGLSAGDPIRLLSPDGRAMAADSTGRITVVLPAGWNARGTGWAGQRGSDGELEPALVLSPDPGRWRSDPSVPGAFIGLSRTWSDRGTPAALVAERQHDGCTAAPVRIARPAEVDWVVASFTGCASGKPRVVEAVGTGPGTSGLVYAQVTPPPGSGPEFVDTLLGGIRIRR